MPARGGCRASTELLLQSRMGVKPEHSRAWPGLAQPQQDQCSTQSLLAINLLSPSHSGAPTSTVGFSEGCLTMFPWNSRKKLPQHPNLSATRTSSYIQGKVLQAPSCWKCRPVPHHLTAKQELVQCHHRQRLQPEMGMYMVSGQGALSNRTAWRDVTSNPAGSRETFSRQSLPVLSVPCVPPFAALCTPGCLREQDAEDKRLACIPAYLCLYLVIESQNHFSWKSPLRSFSPTSL